LIVQLFIESGLLALLGGVAGLAIAKWGGALVRHALLDELPTDGAIVDARTLAFTTGIAVASGLIAGLAPVNDRVILPGSCSCETPYPGDDHSAISGDVAGRSNPARRFSFRR
jgi:hypothetical protein